MTHYQTDGQTPDQWLLNEAKRLEKVNAELLAALRHISPKMRRDLADKNEGSRNIYGEVVHESDLCQIREMERDIAIVHTAIARAEGSK